MKTSAHCGMLAACSAVLFATLPPPVRGEPPAPAQTAVSKKEAPPRKIDLNLARMSKTMRDAWARRLLDKPGNFCGKIVQIAGDFFVDGSGGEGKRRYLCMLKDPAGCCDMGAVEFLPGGNRKWPDDFPDEFESITVNGRLEVVRNGDGEEFARLADAEIVDTPKPKEKKP